MLILEFKSYLGKNLITFIPTAAKTTIRKTGLLSGKELLNHPELLKLAAKSRHQTSISLKKDITKHLHSWHKYGSEGVNCFFALPPKNIKLSKKHPFFTMNLTKIEVNIDKLLQNNPDTIIYGQELIPYDKNSPNKVRHHVLNKKEFEDLQKKSAKEIWKDYKDEKNEGFYAVNVPHVAIITKTGKISPEYLNIG